MSVSHEPMTQAPGEAAAPSASSGGRRRSSLRGRHEVNADLRARLGAPYLDVAWYLTKGDGDLGLDLLLGAIEPSPRGGTRVFGEPSALSMLAWSRALASGLAGAQGLEKRLASIPSDSLPPPAGDDSPEEGEFRRSLVSALALFRAGITAAATLAFPEEVDAHDAELAKQQPRVVAGLAARIAGVFETLSRTPFDAGRSFLDVTTVVVGSEFSRTMRQPGKPIDATGTDHNALTNSVLLAGRGIRGGRIVGASDARALGEMGFTDISGAHAALDRAMVKAMGRPYDFAGRALRTDRPDAYRAGDYIGFTSILNSLLALFGVPASAYGPLDRTGVPAPLLTEILA